MSSHGVLYKAAFRQRAAPQTLPCFDTDGKPDNCNSSQNTRKFHMICSCFFVIFVFFIICFFHFLHQFFCYQFSKEPVTETNETNDGNQWLKEASDGNQWNQWRKPVTETNETNDGNQWRKYIISMLPMITTGFGYGYSLRHSSVVSASTAHTLTNSFVNHPPPHPIGCGNNMKIHSE